MNSLYDKLIKLSESDVYPFHMPGHKRNMHGRANEDLYDIDITEIDGFDNLHHAGGILREIKERAGLLYSKSKTWISVNGSTAGILSAISAVCKETDTIILDRGSHKSAYNACALKKLSVVFAYPELNYRSSVIRGGIDPKQIEQLIDECNPKAVFITSPTYDGVVSDIGTIANICHKNSIPLIVDEAHGAHFFMDDRFPADALSQGADVVIHSIHKTLPAPTQTALVHMQGELVPYHALDTYMGLYQTSSPSYVLMAAIEQCLDIIEHEGRNLCNEYFRNHENFVNRISGLENIDVLGFDSNRDRSKIIIVPKVENRNVNGISIGSMLRNIYHIEPEMVTPDYVCALSSIMDNHEGFERLADALYQMDEQIDCFAGYATQTESKGSYGLPAAGAEYTLKAASEVNDFFLSCRMDGKRYVMDLDIPKIKCELESSVGQKSGGFVQLYPPGIPMLIPGEVITYKAVNLIRRYQECNLLVEGVCEDGIWILK